MLAPANCRTQPFTQWQLFTTSDSSRQRLKPQQQPSQPFECTTLAGMQVSFSVLQQAMLLWPYSVTCLGKTPTSWSFEQEHA
jgi:hypothetical protein